MIRSPGEATPVRVRLFDRQAIALISVIFLSEAAIAAIFFSLVPQYTERLLSLRGAVGDQSALAPGAAAAYTGYAQSAYGFAKLPSQPVSGWLADRFGSRLLLLLGLAASLAAVAAMAAAPSVLPFVAACALFGITAAVIWPAVFALVGDFYEPSARGRLTAAISGAQMSGTAIGFAAGAVLIGRASYSAGFGLAVGLLALALLLSVGRGHAQRRSHSRHDADATPSAPLPRIGLLRSVVSPDLALLCAILVLVSLSLSVLVPDLKPYSSGLGLSFATFAVLLAVPGGVAVLTLIPSGLIADKLGRSVPMLLAAGLWSGSIVLIPTTQSISIAVLLASVAAFAYALGLPAWSASLIDLSFAGRRGVQVGFASALQAVGLAAGPAAGGMLVARFGTPAPFRCSAILMAVVLVLSVARGARPGAMNRGDSALDRSG